MSIFSKFGDEVKDLGKAFSGKNSKDPFSRLANVTSPSMFLTKQIGNKTGLFNDTPMDQFADWNNEKLGDILNTQDKGSGAGQWIGNKPASTIGALITGGMFAGGAMAGGGGAGGAAPTSAAPTAGTAAPAAAPAGAAAPAAQPVGWEQWMQRFQQMPQGGSGQQGQAEPQPAPMPLPQPMARPIPPGPAQNTSALVRSRQDASLNPSLGQLLSNYGGGY